ncbi:MAG TPA: N-acetylmuramoyl-L-alanine amidase [Steroidobacteraceae bacterium]|nr:N-acetylmuramoyl-L-alanine amidase [Steroidobacteraceae bacterium]
MRMVHGDAAALRGLKRLVLLGAAAVVGCSGQAKIDTHYHAVSQDSRVQFIVLHYTEIDFARSLHRLTEEEVSSHYLVNDRPPTIYRLVDEDRRAWHAGPSYWQGYTHLNSSSIGIEIVNSGNGGDPNEGYAEYPGQQIEQVIELVRDVQRRHGVRPDRVLGHSDVQPLTKQDPGPRFPWYQLALAGLIVWPDPDAVAAARLHYGQELPAVSWFQQRLAAHGFEVRQNGQLDDATRASLSAFQMKYRPARYDGVPDAETAALLEVCTRPGGWVLKGVDGQWHSYQTLP